MIFRVENVTRGTSLGDSINLADSRQTRKTGLLKHTSLAPEHGLWIRPCEAIHTFFMKFAIDLVYIDKKLKVKKVREAVGPWRVSGCLSAHSVIELPVGVIAATRTVAGDQLTAVGQS
ncbi:MAG: hypothetical protein JWN34_5415 [Bryobacterales bacterium]|nr:hypothetical protein [Bryobacterales bacterium]